MRASALMRMADETAVPAGHALAVDRVEFSRRIGEAIAAEPRIRVIREEVTRLDTPDEDGTKLTIVATGPLTSDALSAEIERITGSGHLAFYDSISPIVETDSIDMERVYMAARWEKGTADYINCPMDRAEYDRFLMRCWGPRLRRRKSGRQLITLRAVCRLRCWRGGGATRCALGR